MRSYTAAHSSQSGLGAARHCRLQAGPMRQSISELK
jgi:hypothetical protein